MKIVYCINYIIPFGGREKVTLVKINALARIPGNELFVVVTDHIPEKLIDLNPNVTLIDLKVNYSVNSQQTFFLDSLKKIIKHYFRLRKELERIKPDVVIATGLSEKYFLTRGFVRNHWTKYVREFHSASNYRSIIKNGKSSIITKLNEWFDLRFICPKYDLVVTLTPQDIEENWKNAKNVTFMPNPLTTYYPEEIIELKKRKPKIVSIGRLTKSKNHYDLLLSFLEVSYHFPEVILEIIGEGEERYVLQKFIDDHNLNDKVKLCGWHSDISQFIKDATLMVHTSNLEGFPLVFFEAMGYGVPVVAYDCQFGPSFIIDDNITGVLVKQHDQKKLTLEIINLLRNDDKRIEYGLRSRSKALLFQPNIIAQEWMDLFYKLTSKDQKFI